MASTVGFFNTYAEVLFSFLGLGPIRTMNTLVVAAASCPGALSKKHDVRMTL
jgi:hypothetical protein